MGNNANQVCIRGGEGRYGETRWPTQEPLALKLIRDKVMGSDSLSDAFGRNAFNVYDALVEIITMRGNGCKITADDFYHFRFLGKNILKPAREFLEELGLLRVHKQKQPQGGYKQDIYYTLLPAPYLGYTPDWSREKGEETPVSEIVTRPPEEDAPPVSQNMPRETSQGNGDSEDSGTPPCHKTCNKEVNEVLPSGSTYVDPSGIQECHFEDPEQHYLKRQGPRSLASWSRSDIAEWHAGNPDTPPPGSSFTQAVACAIATTSDFDKWVSEVEGGFSAFYGWLHRYLNNAQGGYRLLYRDWMDGALWFRYMPVPEDGRPNLKYWIVALRGQASTLAGRRVEREHETQKADGWSEDGGFTEEDVLAMRRQMQAEGVM